MKRILLLVACACAPREAAEPPARAPAAEPSGPATPVADPCPHVEGPDAIRLPYASFGPPAMAFDLLGQAWWQWDNEGHAFDAQGGVVWIVVHDGLDEHALAQRFPVLEAQRCDHRYVALGSARTYLIQNIDELAELGNGELDPIRDTLHATQRTLEEHFRSSSP